MQRETKFQDPTSHTITVNGHEITAVVQYLYDYDQEPIHVDLGSNEEGKAYAERFDSGELVSLNILIKATWRDVTGHDSLCACHVTSRTAESELVSLATEHGMVEQALEQLKAHIDENIKIYTVLSIRA